jgi:hypothetical protein
MAAPLVRRRLRASAKESVDDLAQMQQITESAEIVGILSGIVRQRLPGPLRVPIGPVSRNQRPAAVRQDHQNEEHAASANAADHGQRPAFEGMALPGDRHVIRDITAMGSLSPLPSTGSTTTS